MKYKGKVLPSLEGVEAKLAMLINVVEGNKPMNPQDALRALKEIHKTVLKNIELIELEPDDALRGGPNLV